MTSFAGSGPVTPEKVREVYRVFAEWQATVPAKEFERKRKEAELLFRRLGITFLVYGKESSTERLIPFDVIPRIFTADEWQIIHDGCCQRVRAINAFLHDIYHNQDILQAGRIPAEEVLINPQYRPEMQGLDVPGGVYVHIAGLDLVRTGERDFYVLEDNLRTPSGVSYMLENRNVMMRLFPDLFSAHKVAPVDNYPAHMLESLRGLAPGVSNPTVVLLSPGAYNSAYFEHVFLADQMGIDVVEGQDLFVKNGHVFMRTTKGPQQVDVIYRRVDDDFLDPLAFHRDSMLGVPGLLAAYRAGNVTLANAIGTGVADDKSMYVHVPEMVRFYLGEEPKLSNVPTYVLRDDKDRAYVLDNLDKLVVKEVHGSGGYGMLVGPAATTKERQDFAKRILANPGNYIAQPTLALSTCPTFVAKGIAPRHVDFRPFVITGKTQTLVPGGLTRVALIKDSLVVNSSQGGGTKDTWILEA
ncbi:MAG TPA: circularly permuted type 2 ATP-grasp protein [Alphaproteobacteria bacterium]